MNAVVAKCTPYVVFTGRATRRFFRSSQTVGSTIIFPLLLLLTMAAVFSSAVEGFDNEPYVQRLVPGLVVGGLMFGSVGTVTGFFDDLRHGFSDRIRSLPVPLSAPLVGVVVAELVRAAMALAVLVVAGSILGFRFASLGGALGFVAVAGLAAVAIVWVGLLFATIATSQEAFSAPLGAIFLVLLFFSGSLVPVEGYPGWAQPLVRWNPAGVFTTALDNLAQGLPAGRSVLLAIGWSVIITGVFGSLAIRGIRRTSLRT